MRVVYHVPDLLWEKAAGFGGSGGVLCVPCFDDTAVEHGFGLLRWTCATDDSVMSG